MYILTEALSEIDITLTKITGDIYEIFHGLSSEMQFYDAAIKYCEFVSSAGVTLCTPKIMPMESELTDLTGLRDLLLICEGMTNEQIIPNDLSLQPDLDGMLIRGSNNTGKTVFLRSAGLLRFLPSPGFQYARIMLSFRLKAEFILTFQRRRRTLRPEIRQEDLKARFAV